MKLLFILDTVDYPTGVNAQLARRLACTLAQQGHTIHLLELWDGQTPPPKTDGCTVFRLSFADERIMNDVLEHGSSAGTPIPVRLAKLCLHPAAAVAAVRMIGIKRPRRQAVCQRQIQKLDQTEHYDAAIAVAAPYYAAFALADAAIHAKKAVWQMDPYTANQQARQNAGALARELHLYRCVDRMFITQLMQPDFEQEPFAAFAHKTQVLDFPCLVPTEYKTDPLHTPDNPVRCVFAGNLYPGVRTPHFALELFDQLDLPDIQLVFVGGGWQQFPGLMDTWSKALGNRLVLTGALPPDLARAQIAQADILLNLGNGVANQLPSKIFEYFGSGKPVLNLARIANDPALAYFQRYPLACTVLESEGTGPEVCQRVRSFILGCRKKRVPFEQVEKLFVQNTPNAVAQALLRGLSL